MLTRAMCGDTGSEGETPSLPVMPAQMLEALVPKGPKLIPPKNIIHIAKSPIIHPIIPIIGTSLRVIGPLRIS